MRLPTSELPWYIEVPGIESPEKISLHLTRHLELRTAVGPVTVVTSRPATVLPVIKKRWMKVIREVERQYSSTLDRLKKQGLGMELRRLRQVTFAINAAFVNPPADVIFTTAEHLATLNSYRTLYILDPLSDEQKVALHGHLLPESLIVSYCDF